MGPGGYDGVAHSPQPMRFLACSLLALPAVALAQESPEARSIPSVHTFEEQPATVYRFPNDSLNARRWRTVTTFFGATGGYLALGVTGAMLGYDLDEPDCPDDICVPLGMVIGWAIGSTLGAGLGAHLGGRRSGSLPLALAVSGGVQIGLWLYSSDGVAMLIPVSVLASTIADRVSASGRVD